MSLKKQLSFAIATSLILTSLGCTTPTTNPTDKKSPSSISIDNNTNSATTIEKKEQQAIKLDGLNLQLEDPTKTRNPINPEDIDYIELNGTKIMAKDIVIAKSKDEVSNGIIRFTGSGIYVFNSSPNNKDIINLKLKKSDKVMTLPILKDGFSLKAVGEGSTFNGGKYAYGNIDGTSSTVFVNTNADGTPTGAGIMTGSISDFKNLISLSINFSTNTISISKGLDTKRYNLNDLVSKDAPTGTEVTEETKKQLATIKEQAQSTTKNPFDSYVGIWSLNYAGAKFISTIRKSGTSGFVITTIINDKTFSSSGTYDSTKETLESVSFDSSFNKEKFSAKVTMVNSNNLTLSVTSSDTELVKPFINTPIPLARKVD